MGGGRRSVARDASVLRRLVAFAERRGIEPVVEVLLCRDVIEAFVVSGCAGLSLRSRATYRSALYHLADELGLTGDDRRRPTPLAATARLGPYDEDERAGLLAMAAAQRDRQKRDSALALLLLGFGVGMRPGEVVLARGDDVSAAAGRVVALVRGELSRVVPVTERYAERLSDLARRVGSDHLFRPGPAKRRYKNFVCDFVSHLSVDPGLVQLSATRCRSSFICDHLRAGTPLAELVRIAGIEELDSLARYLCHVPGQEQGKAALHRRAEREAVR